MGKKIIKSNWVDEEISFATLNVYMQYTIMCYNEFMKEKIKDIDLTTTEFYYVYNIYLKDKLSQKNLADTMFVSEANVARIIKKLEDKGYVVREISPENKSKKILSLTKKGESSIKTIIEYNKEWEEKISYLFTEEELVDLKHKLLTLTEKSIEILL